jgi:hypothetical protein
MGTKWETEEKEESSRYYYRFRKIRWRPLAPETIMSHDAIDYPLSIDMGDGNAIACNRINHQKNGIFPVIFDFCQRLSQNFQFSLHQSFFTLHLSGHNGLNYGLKDEGLTHLRIFEKMFFIDIIGG